jgi:hypothetical protein
MATQSALREQGPLKGRSILTDHSCNPTVIRQDAGGYSRVACTVTAQGRSAQLVYGNFFYDFGDRPGPNPILLRASVEYPAGTYYPIDFPGGLLNRAVQIAPGEFAVSIPVDLSLIPGRILWVNTNVEPVGGKGYCIGTGISLAKGEISIRNTVVDYTLEPPPNQGIAGDDFVCSPLAVIGEPTSEPPRTVAIIGDSIAAGAGDISYAINGYYINGWCLRALDQTVGYLYLTRTGERLSDVVGEGWRYRRQLLSGIYSALVEYGRNDMNQGLLATQLYAIDMWTRLSGRGIKVYQSTVTCQTNSTDAWTTVAGQSLLTVFSEGARLLYNGWLRDGAPLIGGSLHPDVVGSERALRIGAPGHPVTGLVDNCDVVESGRGTGTWKPAERKSLASATTLGNGIAVLQTNLPHGIPPGAGGGLDGGATVVVNDCGPPFDGVHQVDSVIDDLSVALQISGVESASAHRGTLLIPWTADGTHPSFLGHQALAQASNLRDLLLR